LQQKPAPDGSCDAGQYCEQIEREHLLISDSPLPRYVVSRSGTPLAQKWQICLVLRQPQLKDFLRLDRQLSRDCARYRPRSDRCSRSAILSGGIWRTPARGKSARGRIMFQAPESRPIDVQGHGWRRFGAWCVSGLAGSGSSFGRRSRQGRGSCLRQRTRHRCDRTRSRHETPLPFRQKPPRPRAGSRPQLGRSHHETAGLPVLHFAGPRMRG
jgi:hypothetical protein